MSESSVVAELRTKDGLSEVPLEPTEAGIEEALHRLDGVAVSLVTVRNGENELFVGGGPECFTVTLLMNDGDSVALAGPPGAEGEVKMIVGGQLIDQPKRLLVDLPTAVRAANWFLHRGKLAPGLKWERPG